jgi:uncharacterized protein with beta-barrel porin domain
MNFTGMVVAAPGSRTRKALLAGTALAAVALLPSAAQAQSVWGGTGSTTITTDYNLGTNWSTNPTPPTIGGESAQFDATGSATVVVTAGTITPDSWTFNADSQSYTVSGQAVHFGNAGTLTNNASAGQAISISNNMTGTTLTQDAASTLTISGINSFTTTSVSAGTLVNNGALTSTVGITGTGTFTNNLTVTGTVTNGATSTFTNNVNGTVSGLVINSGTGTNSGILNGALENSGGFSNTGTVNNNLVNFSTGTYTQTAGSTNGGVNNNGGTINANGGAFTGPGAISNNGAGTFNVGGTVTSDTSFNNSNAAARLLVNSGSFTITGVVSNSGTDAAGGVLVAVGATLSAGGITNNAGATYVNNGTTNGGLTNNGTGTNTGTLNGGLTNSGTFTQTAGSTNGGTINTGTIDANGGAINGAIANNAGGTFNVGGTVTSNSTFNNSTATSRLLVSSGSYAVTGTVTNSGTNAAGGILVAAGATLSADGITNTAGATFINNGTTSGAVNNAGTFTNNLTLTGTVSNSATFNNNANGTLSGLLTNTAGTMTNAGQLNGGATISGGTVVLTSSGSVTGLVTAGTGVATATFDISGTTAGASIQSLTGASDGIVTLGTKTLTLTAASNTFGGVIGGNGGLALTSGTETLTGANNYSGTTTVNAGTLALTGSGSIAQSSLVTVGAGAASTFDISGTTSGASIVGLAGDSNGIVTLGSKTLTITNASGGNQFFGAINGAGGLTVTGGAQQVLGGNNSYTGVTTINSGSILGLLGTGSIASSSKVIDNGGFDLSVMSVNSSITSLAGTNAGANVFLGSHSLTLTAANDTYAGQISGTGGLTLAGGTETLTGSIGYSGATTINGGTLVVNSSLASSSGVTVNTGGTLSGAGTVATTSIAGGTFAPGSGTPGSSLTVNGALGFTAASTYAVNINPTTSSFANATGTATLGGATVNAIYASGSYVAKQYTILTAGVVSGTFGSVVNSNLPANFKASLSYDAKDAFLNLALNFTPPPSGAPGFGVGLNTNQQNVGNALTNFFNATGGIPLVFGALTPAGLSQASGEIGTGSQQTTFNAMTQFMGVMTDPFIDGRGNGGAPSGGGASGYASTQNAGAARDAYAMFTKVPVTTFEQRWSTWIAGYGGSQTTGGNTAVGSNSTTSSVYGTAVGADYRFSPDTLAGFSLAGGGTNFSVSNSGTGHSDLLQAGAFVRHTVGPAYLSAALAYGWQDVTTNRTVTVAGIDQLRARFDANAFSGRVEGGYRFVTPWIGGVGITPYAAGQFTTFDLPSYAESVLSGASTFALSYDAKSVTDTRSELGIRTDKSWAMQDSILTLRSRFAWAHDYDPDRSVAATFQTLPGASFVVNGAAQASDSALTTASAEIKWINGFSVAATFEGEFSDVTRSYAGKGVVRYAW